MSEEQPGMFKVIFGEFGNNGIREEEEDAELENEHNEEERVLVPTTVTHTDENISLPRRSTRVTKKPSYLDDYVQIAEEDSEYFLLLLDEEPWDLSEAMKEKVWTEACEDEISSIIKNGTWTLVDLPAGEKAISLQWIFKIKRNADGTINKYKSRLVSKGYIQRYGIDFEEVFAPVARTETVRFIIALAASRG